MKTKFLSAAGVLAIAGTLLAPSSAFAADLDCGDDEIVVSIMPEGTALFGSAEQAINQTVAPVDRLPADVPSACFLGEVTPPLYENSGQSSAKVSIPGKGKGEFYAKLDQVAHFVPVDPLTLNDYAVVPSEALQLSFWGALVEGSRDAFAAPARPLVAGTKPALVSTPGLVLRTDNEHPGVSGRNKLSEELFKPILDPSDDSTVLWIDSAVLAPLPSPDSSTSEFTIHDEGWELYRDPTSDVPDEQLEPGDTFDATAMQSGWRYTTDNGGAWLKAPDKVITDGESEDDSLIDRAKEKGSDLWGTAKEKSSELGAAVKENVAEKKADSKTLTFPAMLSAMILSGLSFVFSLISFIVKRARGLRNVTPPGLAKTGLAFVAAPAAGVLAVFAAGKAPTAWSFAPWVALGAGAVAAVALYVFSARLRGGSAHDTTAAMQKALYNPASISAGIAAAAVFGGAAYLADGSWRAYIAAALATVGVYAGAALTTQTKPDTDPVTRPEPEASTDHPIPPDAENAAATTPLPATTDH